MYRSALPVAGHTEWLAFLASPHPTEQCPSYEPHRQNMMGILDHLKADPHADPLSDEGAYHRLPAGVCLLCNGPWFCKCLAEKRSSWGRCRSRSRSRGVNHCRPPTSVFPGMVDIQQLRAISQESQSKVDQEVPALSQPASAKVVRNPPPRVAFPLECVTEVGGCSFCGGQTDWEEVKAHLSDEVLHLERCKPMFTAALRDYCTSVWLPNDKNYAPHVTRVVASLPLKLKFKIGITVDPENRFYHAPYAYSKPHTQERDGVRYVGMIIVHVHQERDRVATMEHCMQEAFKGNSNFKSRMTNMRSEFDDHIQFDHSDEENEAAPGPHCVYIVYGMPRARQ